MLSDLTNEQRELETFMSDISERCWYAGWLEVTEYILWDEETAVDLPTWEGMYHQAIIANPDLIKRYS
ncbi:MAG TPA: hypothetical protein VFZ47_06855 [Chitinophagaceae bacterium]